MDNFSTNIAAVILAGGRSSRMGEDKASLRHDGKTMLQKMGQILESSEISQIYVNNELGIKDILSGHGPLGGVHASLEELHKKHDYLLYVPIDMPNLKSNLLNELISAPTEFEVVKFMSHSLPFRLKCDSKYIGVIEGILRNSDDYSLKSFQKNLSIQEIGIEENQHNDFKNINTPEEWDEYKAK